MQQIVDWLKKLGLDQYAQRFSENDIDVSVLPYLTDQDLDKIGVSLGHRRKLLAAIAELARPAPVWPALTEPKPQVGAERRHLTVMFCDLVGSTALSAHMDPEDLRDLIGAYHKCVAETVSRFDGFVAKYMGDGILTYFGYPQAHEDDAERAVRAGLALIDAVHLLRKSERLGVRVGIGTGLVVVGDLIGSGEAQERGIVGETPNLAARLQSIAEPSTIVIGPTTRRLLADLFEYQDLGPINVKGFDAPVQAYQVLRPSSVESRFEAMRTTTTPLIGRDEEIEILMRRWRRAKEGYGQVVLISGEPGIGKSRLTAAILEHLAAESHTRLRYFCSPQHTDRALHPIIGQVERAAGLAHDDKPQARLDKLDAVLAQTSTSAQDAALFAEMLSLPNDGRYPALALTSEQRRQRTLEVLISQLTRLAGQNPVLMIFEDAHWVDPTSLEVFGLVVDRIPRLRILLIVTYRPEFNAPWVGQSHVTSLTLNRLGEREVGGIIARLAGNKSLPNDVITEIVERTDGIPLFVEELTKAVMEAESEGAARHAVSTVPRAALAIPASLHASLMARLDRLGAAKEVAQIGAAIGREFSHALLAVVTRGTGVELGSALDRLIQAGLLFRQGIPPHANYLFKHALVQDAAYDTLLRDPRRALHRRIAKALESEFPEIAESQPELLAHHCTEAGLIELAIGYWLKAGQRATVRSANMEAISHLTKGLDLLAPEPGSPKSAEHELMFQISLAVPLTAVKGYAAPEPALAYARARELCNTLGDTRQLFPAMYGEWVYHMVKAHQDEAKCVAEEFLRLAKQHGARDGIVVAHRTLGLSLLNLGQLQAGREHMEQVLKLYEPESHGSLAFRYGQDPRAAALSFLAWIEWLQGYPETATKHCQDAIDLARNLSHATTTAYALSTAPYVHCFCGDVPAARDVAEAAVAFGQEVRNPFWLAMARVIWGWVFAMEGQVERGLAEIRSGLDEWRATDSAWLWPCYLALLAEALTRANQTEQALEAIDNALAAVSATRENFYLAELHRLRGVLLRRLRPQQNEARAESECLQALEIAKSQGARSLELRAATSLGHLWRDQGKRTEAHDLLAPIYGWFTEGFDTPVLKDAKALLDELA